jgi:DNA modification methylase
VQEEAPAYRVDLRDFVTLEAAAAETGKTIHNIRDYIQRGRIAKFSPVGERIQRAVNGQLRVSLREVKAFLSLVDKREDRHHHAGLTAELGFYGLAERDRTKHVHRLHPYLGKFIPQLVEWFLRQYFREDDIVIDPFMGSGTTLVQANEMRIHSIGIDISHFNCHIARAKTAKYDFTKARRELLEIESRTSRFSQQLSSPSEQLPLFNEEKLENFKEQLFAECDSEYLKSWFAPRALLEILYARRLIFSRDYEYVDLLKVFLSRAVRSSRLIPHNDLATPKAPLPVGVRYWCEKHDKMCMPIDNCITKIHAYTEDTARRIAEFDKLRSGKTVSIVQGDSREVDLTQYLHSRLADGIFTSPPYVGQIDYHDQHVYAYELFGFPRNDTSEIGPKSKGKSLTAQSAYVQSIAAVFRHMKAFLKPDANVFVVANDKLRLYPDIAELSGYKIKEVLHRAVTKRTEKGGDPYQESIFQMVKS